MLNRSKSFIYIVKNNNTNNIANTANIFYKKLYKSSNDLISLSNQSFPKDSKRKIISYSQFLKSNPKANKKQRVEAIQNFYNNLLK
jgi:hypothetical protein